MSHLKRPLVIIGIFFSLLLITTGCLLMLRHTAKAPTSPTQPNTEISQPQPAVSEDATKPATPAAASFDKNQFSLTTPSSIWMVVNKKRPLPGSYTPASLTAVGGQQLRKEAADQLNVLLAAAKNSGQSMMVISGYRSYASQQNTYNSYVKRDGQAAADRYSARPGFSEHQTGLAADLGAAHGTCALEICFADTSEGKWLAAHAHEYGFIIRYIKDGESRTGYQYEPWHIRYVGKDLADQLHTSRQTMEEFFNLPAAAGY
jgi:D-alanyl-D-alanine carboxypeptidase